MRVTARGTLPATGACLDQLKQDVRKAPRDARLRTFLFQMFCITGEWDRALTQLTVAGGARSRARSRWRSTYRAAIRCEMLREKVFAASARRRCSAIPATGCRC